MTAIVEMETEVSEFHASLAYIEKFRTKDGRTYRADLNEVATVDDLMLE